MTKHTPGPWVVGERVKTARLDNALMIRPADHGNYKYGATAIISTSEANARLIAAAPDMLDALQHIARTISYDEELQDRFFTGYVKARDAIAKAIGENK